MRQRRRLSVVNSVMNRVQIERIQAHKILDSAGEWTVETSVSLTGGVKATASVPSGVSTSPYEAQTVSAARAVRTLNDSVDKELRGFDPRDQEALDTKLTELGVGANTTLSVSLAVCRATAKLLGRPLYRYINEIYQVASVRFQIPKLFVLLFEGGKHGSGKPVSQEFMAVAKDINHGLKLYRTVRDHLKKTGQSLSVGLEGGFTPDLNDKQALEVLNYILGGNSLALDVAFESHRRQGLNYQYFIGDLNLKVIEDPFGVEDWGTWVEFTRGWQAEVLVVADDLVATNAKRLKEAIARYAANAVIIKPNQIGTLSATLEVVRLAKGANWKVIVSHRGHETNDDFIADLAVGVGADFVKFGGFSRGERLSKYNRLLKIQSEIV